MKAKKNNTEEREEDRGEKIKGGGRKEKRKRGREVQVNGEKKKSKRKETSKKRKVKG